ncbi:MAG: hypothetical protein JNN06_00705 [Gemmobacter sp.]|uniref:hypothetical protein n=1 Tax=Gemmobacter sp. TaxID=1898957 RepID=UPI001A5834D3|nr:hypothetical protein [Gemmobacter sp.]MBL8560773.1 hypothetical protein [Gemmobacter sp.]
MTLQNRVQADGEIVAAGWRGAWMGNRGILHDDNRQLGPARWRHQNWVCCALSFEGRKRAVMAPGRYTELFFYDEAQALAAGHRPCAECRRADYTRYRSAWEAVFGPTDAKAMDRALHAARVRRNRTQLRLSLPAQDLPQGAVILRASGPALIWHGALHGWSPEGYGPAEPLPQGSQTILTPAPTLAVLAAGYVLRPHASLPSRPATPYDGQTGQA